MSISREDGNYTLEEQHPMTHPPDIMEKARELLDLVSAIMASPLTPEDCNTATEVIAAALAEARAVPESKEMRSAEDWTSEYNAYDRGDKEFYEQWFPDLVRRIQQDALRAKVPDGWKLVPEKHFRAYMYYANTPEVLRMNNDFIDSETFRLAQEFKIFAERQLMTKLRPAAPNPPIAGDKP